MWAIDTSVNFWYVQFHTEMGKVRWMCHKIAFNSPGALWFFSLPYICHVYLVNTRRVWFFSVSRHYCLVRSKYEIDGHIHCSLWRGELQKRNWHANKWIQVKGWLDNLYSSTAQAFVIGSHISEGVLGYLPLDTCFHSAVADIWFTSSTVVAALFWCSCHLWDLGTCFKIKIEYYIFHSDSWVICD